jgi:hypothetical protein
MVSPTQPQGLQGIAVLRAGGPWGGGWLIWLPMGLCTMLMVLFVVVVGRQQDQANKIGELTQRIQNLEHSRALERTAVLEQQLRSTAARLQVVEKGQQRLSDWERQLQTLRQEMDLRRSFESTHSDLLNEPPLSPSPKSGRSTPPNLGRPMLPDLIP